MIETACQFGHGEHLVGIVAEPGRQMSGPVSAPARRMAVVLVNAGLVPKLGPYRMYVQLARRLAQAGFVVLRFDLGGLGDSTAAHTHVPRRVRTALEIKSAVDHICARDGIDGVLIGGLCSGAEDSFRYAEVDSRVRGVMMIDPFGYRTRGWRWRHLAYRALRRTLRATGVYAPAGVVPGKVVTYTYMEQAEAARILATLLARRAPVHFIYTGGARETFNHPAQLPDMFPGITLAPLVTLDHLPALEHTALLDEDRRTLIDAIAAWVDRAVPAGP